MSGADYGAGKWIGRLYGCSKLVPDLSDVEEMFTRSKPEPLTVEIELEDVNPDVAELLASLPETPPAGWVWQAVPKDDPSYDEKYCTHRLVRYGS